MENKILIDLEKNKTRCKKCENFYILEYPSGKRFFYCQRKGSNRTDNGMKKIKANDPGCREFIKKEN